MATFHLVGQVMQVPLTGYVRGQCLHLIIAGVAAQSLHDQARPITVASDHRHPGTEAGQPSGGLLADAWKGCGNVRGGRCGPT